MFALILNILGHGDIKTAVILFSLPEKLLNSFQKIVWNSPILFGMCLTYILQIQECWSVDVPFQ